MNVADRMRELIKILRDKGLEGVKFLDIYPFDEEHWSPDYAVARDICYDQFILDDDSTAFYDVYQLRDGLLNMVRKHFAEDPAVHVQLRGEHRRGIREIEARRERPEPPIDRLDNAREEECP
jgi:hypothetical protein